MASMNSCWAEEVWESRRGSTSMVMRACTTKATTSTAGCYYLKQEKCRLRACQDHPNGGISRLPSIGSVCRRYLKTIPTFCLTAHWSQCCYSRGSGTLRAHVSAGSSLLHDTDYCMSHQFAIFVFHCPSLDKHYNIMFDQLVF